jgi:hypothetical protein
MEAAPNHVELAGPWRRAALVATVIAGLEMFALVAVGVAMLSGPIAHHLRSHAAATAAATAAAAAAKPKPPVVHHFAPKRHVVAKPDLRRTQTRVLVLNGNGHQGAASVEASRLQSRGYRVSATGNAKRMNYATSIVMFRSGFEPEARRLARDFGIRVVAPLDGLRPRELKGAHLAVVVGN